MALNTLSQAHQMLLAQFRTAREVPTSGFFAGHAVAEWNAALRQSLSAAVKALISQGLLRAATSQEILESTLKVPEIKDQLRKLSLPLSGKKVELVERLAQADPALAKSLAKGRLLHKSTAEGTQQITDFLKATEAARSAMEDSVTHLLAHGDYREAAHTLARFEAAQVFPRGMGVDWAHYDTARDEKVLELIFAQLPQSLSNASARDLPTFRIAAGMLHLVWNVGQTQTWLSSRFPSQDQDALFKISSDLHSFALFLAEIDTLTQIGCPSFQVMTCNDDLVCPGCRELASNPHSLNSEVQIPNPRCSSDWCRCWIGGSWPDSM